VTIYQVDAFTDEPFAGNPAGVCIMEHSAHDEWMQNVAMEMNLAETAFLYPVGDVYNLRWFTPTIEVDLCGHATLASAHILYEQKIVSADVPIRFQTRSGLLTAEKRGEWIELNFPATPAVQLSAPVGLLAALGIDAVWVGQSKFDYLVEVASAMELRELTPDFDMLQKLGGRGVIVTAESSTPQLDFISRFFAPCAGVNEDPVTGSAHCTLAPYWESKLRKSEMVGYQASKRGGVVRVRRVGDRVMLGGQAVTWMRGEV